MGLSATLLLEALIVIGPLLGSIAYVTIAERKIMGSMQRRIGPNKVGQRSIFWTCQFKGFYHGSCINNNNNIIFRNSGGLLKVVNNPFINCLPHFSEAHCFSSGKVINDIKLNPQFVTGFTDAEAVLQSLF